MPRLEDWKAPLLDGELLQRGRVKWQNYWRWRLKQRHTVVVPHRHCNVLTLRLPWDVDTIIVMTG